MVRRAFLGVIALMVSAGCGGGSSASSAPSSPSSSSGTTQPSANGAPGCDVAFQGPLVGYSYMASPPPPPQGGMLADGTYDLVQIVRHTPNAGPWSSNQAPAFRWSLRFVTRDRSSNHTSGDLTTALEIPPIADCKRGRFATFQGDLRFEGGSKGIEMMKYSAVGDQLVLLDPKGDGGVPTAYVFRRRP